ncbi:HNH endonuclease [Nostoc paludosum FACHB-159]|uniref:HNH endonuclease n=2 Tax=Nostoc TaxID=1177 RepID=A0ABR8KJU8_9NOSO|nr:HNH endonuclease [Nostoc sp. FACHB-857]MBD2738969.1 HNH endonuclease [Nostoc paludosum FACHB-159]
MEEFTEFVMVYEHTKDKFDNFINFILSANFLDEWSKEYLDDKWMQYQVQQWINERFERKTDNIGEKLDLDLIKIIRHIAQNQSAPSYHPFEEREIYDLDKLAYKVIDLAPRVQREYLSKEFSKTGTLWKTFYKQFIRFHTAVNATITSILDREISGENLNTTSGTFKTFTIPNPILTTLEKSQIKKRDGYACLCCGASGKGVRLEIDHVVSVFMGGETSLENSQTLCSICNKNKSINEINFRFNETQLSRPKTVLNLSLPHAQADRDVARVITRIVNFFYHCKSVCQVNWHERRNGQYYSTWEISLYGGNNPQWLLQHKAELLNFIQKHLGYTHVQDIRVVAPGKN